MDKRGLDILIVDDDEEDLVIAGSLLREALKGVRLRLDTAETFEDGLSRIEATHYDLLLFDYQLGEKNGMELMREVRARGIDTPIVLLTGRGGEDIAVEAMKKGASDYLSKSKLSETLMRKSVRRAIELYENQKKRRQMSEALKRTNDDLELWIRELESRRRESFLLSEVGNGLQLCMSLEEAYSLIEQHISTFFTGRSGALCMCAPGNKVVETVAAWGERPPGKPEFDVGECWGLRQGRAYWVDRPGVQIHCPHLRDAAWEAHLCAPLTAQGETLGLLILEGDSPANSTSNGVERVFFATESQRRFAETLSEHLALALANLRLRDALREQALHDALTGLFNRRYVVEFLDKAVSSASRHHRPLSVLMLDVDGFKAFNDRYGHESGDTILRCLGKFLQQHSRREDIASRYGGEEFVLVLPEVSLSVAVAHAEQLRATMREALARDSVPGYLLPTISIGVSSSPEHGTSAQALLRAADAALYRAKNEGRDRVVTAEVTRGSATV